MILRPFLTLLCLCWLHVVSAKKKNTKSATAWAEAPKGITEKTVPLRTHSLYPPYVDADLQNRWYDFGGSSIIDTSKHVRLTQDRQSQSGWLWSRLPLSPNAFQIEFEFKVDGKSNNIFGDGFALWLTRSRAQIGPVFGSLDYWEGLGIFFDTYANSRHSYTFPEVLAMSNDGTKSYDHKRDGAGQESGRCSLNFRRTEVTPRAKLTYFKNNFLQLQMQTEKWDEWEPCFTIYNYTLPGSPYLGFSAHTGDVSDAHDIVQISAYNVVYHEPRAGASSSSSFLGDSESSWTGIFFGFIWFLIKWSIILAIVGVAGLAAYRWNASRSAKRF